MSISTGTAIAIMAAATVASAAGSAYVQQDTARDARKQQNRLQAEQLAAAEAAANKSKAPVINNSGDVELQSTEDMQDEAIRSRSKKNRLRVDKTGLSLGGSSSSSKTGLSI